MSNLRDTLKSYRESKEIIFKLFETDGWEAILDYTSNRWYDSDSWVNYLDEDGVECDFDEAKQCGGVVDGHKLFWIRDNGQEFYVMFSTDNEFDDIDEWEEITK